MIADVMHALRAGEPAASSQLDFVLPPELEAAAPPEARGLARDGVRLMISRIADDSIIHTRFHDLPHFLDPGDLLVINTSGTLPAALSATRADGLALELHLSTQLQEMLWTVELRRFGDRGTAPFGKGIAGETLTLPDGGKVTLLAEYRGSSREGARGEGSKGGARLWIASLDLPLPLHDYLARHGYPIRYHYVEGRWPIEYYQTVYASDPGSAEMPSAGRAFTPELITRLVAKGVLIAPITLHTGVASLEDHEPPYEEFFHVPRHTARLATMTREMGNRVIAVGTTVVRALESVTGKDGTTHEGEGWTGLVITPERGIRSATALLTGMHEPRASHLAMLQALAGERHLRGAYTEALRERYLWHEFGDLHLIV
jgi:S-adenosylmethionine:tRNA ribosyltransferase-isomerase